MRRGLLCVLLWTLAGTARADAIVPYDGECPPGLTIGYVGHAEACVPKMCASNDDCGRGAACRTLCTCRAEREFTSNGRIVYPQPIKQVVEVGLCDRSRRCAEGQRSSRRQCEPIDRTPAFDRRTHSWTRVSHPQNRIGCAIGGTAGSNGALAAAFLLLVLRRRTG